MTDEMKALVELQALDTEILNANRLVKIGPHKIAEAESLVTEADANLAKANKDIEGVDKKRSDRETIISEAKDRLAKLKTRGSEIKDGKAFAAHQKEIDATEKLIKETSTELGYVMENHSRFTARIKEAEQTLADRQKDVASLKAKVASDAGELNGKIKTLMSQRNAIVKRVPADTYKLYKTVMNLHNGVAVVPVTDEICGGCHMNIMPQLFVRIRKGTETLSCPQCRRFLYWPGEEQNPAT